MFGGLLGLPQSIDPIEYSDDLCSIVDRPGNAACSGDPI